MYDHQKNQAKNDDVDDGDDDKLSFVNFQQKLYKHSTKNEKKEDEVRNY